MRRLLSALPYLFLVAAVGIGGWLAWDLLGPETGTPDPDAGTGTIDLDAGTTTTAPSPTTTRPADWVESCEVVLETLQDEGWAVAGKAGDLRRLAEEARAGNRSWYGTVVFTENEMIPRPESLLGTADEVLASDPETVSRIYAEAFRDAAAPLLIQARDLITSVIDPETGLVQEAVWTGWWAEWTASLEELNLVLDRAPASVQNCPD
jgi:hypothetical protein